LAELGEFFLAAAGQTRCLEVHIAELLFIFEVGFEFDHAGAE